MVNGFRTVRGTSSVIGAIGLAVALAGCGGGGGTDSSIVNGETQPVSGQNVTTWARVDNNNIVQEVGVTIPAALIQNPPSTAGTGPAGAMVTPAFPAVVQNSTFFNHFELQWEPQGHPPAYYQSPHFDMHFYGVPVATVQAVTSPDTAAPAANRVPAGYTYPGVNAAVPQMGTHAAPDADFAPGAPAFTKTLILGYYGGDMTFIEPMITQAYLNQHPSYSIQVPQPAALGRSTRYPTQFSETYDASSNAFKLVFSNFVNAQ